MLVLFEVLGQVFNTTREHRNLDLGGSRVTWVGSVLVDDRLLDFGFKSHRSDPLSPRCAVPDTECVSSIYPRPLDGNLGSLAEDGRPQSARTTKRHPEG